MKFAQTAFAALLLSPCVSAAHIQAVPCSSANRRHDKFSLQDFVAPLVLTAQLDSLNATHDRLSLKALPSAPGHDGCEEWANTLPRVGVGLAMLGRDPTVTWKDVGEVCQSRVVAGVHKGVYLDLQTDHVKFPQLSSFELAVLFMEGDQKDNMTKSGHVVSPHFESLPGSGMNIKDKGVAACFRSRATPQPDTLTLSLLRYVPMAVLILVIIAGTVRSLPARRHTTTEESFTPAPVRPVLPDVGDCLQYLQFVFFTGCLSLQYPGFYQPAVSELRWYSLFGTTLFVDSFQYDGFVDGIYAMNGTFGGTYGAELMTQVVGAPLTIGTWLNMLACVGIAAVCVGVLLSGLWYVESTRKVGLLRVGESQPPLVSNVVRVILSYFMFPLVALTVYQFDNARWLPVSHSTLAGLIMLATLAAFAWLIWQIPTRSLGVLIFDTSKRYRRLDEQHPGGPEDPENDIDLATTAHQNQRRDRAFVYILFMAMILRGCAVGGLQISGIAQVLMLLGCEFIFAACVMAFQAYPVFSLGSASACVRIASVAVMIAFLPGLVSDNQKSMIGYGLLGLHAVFLVVGFGGSAMWHLARAGIRRVQRPAGEVYGLRDLQRRPNPQDTPTPSRFHNEDPNPPASPPTTRTETRRSSSRLSLPLPPVSPAGRFSPGLEHRTGSPHSRHLRESIDTTRDDGNRHSYYFRPPRSSTYSPSLSGSSHHARRSHLGISTSIPTSPLSPGGGGLATPLGPVPSTSSHSQAGSVNTIKSESGSRLNTLSSTASFTNDGRRSVSSSRSHNHGSIATTPILEITPMTTATTSSDGQPAKSEALAGIVPRWNDYSFREADLIYGGPDEGDFQAARATYDDGKASTSDGRPSTTASSSARNSNEDDSSQRFQMRDSSSSSRTFATKGLARGGRKISSQLRQLSSSRLFNISSEDKPPEPAETGFSVRRPAIPEHIMKAMAEAEAAAKARPTNSNTEESGTT